MSKFVMVILIWFLIIEKSSLCQEVSLCKVTDIVNLYSNYYVFELINEEGKEIIALSYCPKDRLIQSPITKCIEQESYKFVLLELPIGFKIKLRPFEDDIVFMIGNIVFSRGNVLLHKSYLILNTECDFINEIRMVEENK